RPLRLARRPSRSRQPARSPTHASTSTPTPTRAARPTPGARRGPRTPRRWTSSPAGRSPTGSATGTATSARPSPPAPPGSRRPAGVTAARLRSAGIGAARGFALNVSNFRSNADSEAYGLAVSTALGGGVPFVIDTSRNGAGPAPGDVWCNPPGRGLGTPPTTDTRRPLVDAYLWVKAPGESDGACNGGPPAGTWWPEYALGLAQRAGW